MMEDAALILTKNRVLEKVRMLLEELQARQQAFVRAGGLFAHPLFSVPPKISRGDNYLGLPYLILDYPRLFRADGIAAIRTMFWWGHFFSSTLHLSGPFAESAAPRLATHPGLAARGYHLGIHPDPWVHHFGPDNYRPLGPGEPAEQFGALPHTKVSARWPLSDWPSAVDQLFESWELLLQAGGLVA